MASVVSCEIKLADVAPVKRILDALPDFISEVEDIAEHLDADDSVQGPRWRAEELRLAVADFKALCREDITDN